MKTAMKTDTQKILIVDDEEALLFGFTIFFQSPETSVDTALTLETAEDLIRKKDYAVIISDLMLSDSTAIEGIDIIHYIKEFQPESRIIIVTAYGERALKEKVHTLGIDYFFEKPVSPAQVQEVIMKR